MPAPLSTILVASDGSDESRLAIDRAVRLAEADDAELHLVHVGLLSKWVQPDTLSSKQYERIKQEATDRLETEVAYAEDVGGTVTEAYRRMGKADAEIIELADEIEADLVLLGSRGQNTIERIVLGSDSESIVRYAPCSVMVVRQHS
jgi:Universal stress protein UspA and related nucleotide-binding proteins